MATTKRRKGDATQPESARKNKVVAARLPPHQREQLDALAERYGLAAGQVLALALAVALRDGVLDAACAEARRWADALTRP